MKIVVLSLYNLDASIPLQVGEFWVFAGCSFGTSGYASLQIWNVSIFAVSDTYIAPLSLHHMQPTNSNSQVHSLKLKN